MPFQTYPACLSRIKEAHEPFAVLTFFPLVPARTSGFLFANAADPGIRTIPIRQIHMKTERKDYYGDSCGGFPADRPCDSDASGSRKNYRKRAEKRLSFTVPRTICKWQHLFLPGPFPGSSVQRIIALTVHWVKTGGLGRAKEYKWSDSFSGLPHCRY